MTTLEARIHYDELHEQAAAARPGRALATAIAAVFFAIGWIFGTAWLIAATCFFAVRTGFRDGARMKRVPRQAAPKPETER